MSPSSSPHRINALFLCSRNQWRSPTAEQLWRDSEHINVRARGLSPKAVRVVTHADIAWADIIFVMERAHRSRLIEKFPGLQDHPIHVLDIPDDYQFMDPELVDLLQDRAGPVLDDLTRPQGT